MIFHLALADHIFMNFGHCATGAISGKKGPAITCPDLFRTCPSIPRAGAATATRGPAGHGLYAQKLFGWNRCVACPNEQYQDPNQSGAGVAFLQERTGPDR